MFNLPALCIKRPAFTIVLSLILTIIGLIGFKNLSVRWIPNISPAEVTITTNYPGANAAIIEKDVTKVIEDSLSSINGVDVITSKSKQNTCRINIKFKLGRNLDAAVEDVRSSIERIRSALPKGAFSPVVSKADPDAQAGLYISFSDKTRDNRALSDYIEKYIVPMFETIDGVGNVQIIGKRSTALQIYLDPAKMAAVNITANDVAQLLGSQNASIPSGQIRSADRYYNVITNSALKTPVEFENLIISNKDQQIVRLRDVAEIKLAPTDVDSAFRIKGESGIALGIVTQATANPLDVEKDVLQVVNDLQHTLPAGMQSKVLYDQTTYIRASITSVYESLFEAVLFVWLVIYAFLGNFRATLIPIITIPVCIIGSFAILSAMGFSINTITLMALVLAIGLVVDDAIVMLENISRHIEAGLSPMKAALLGSQEIILPIIAMTLTLVAVYAPIAFTPGLIGTLFREFTFSLAGAVLISGFVALTLTPMMCARILKPLRSSGRYYQWQTAQLHRLQLSYAQLLRRIFPQRCWVLGFLFLTLLAGAWVYWRLPAELTPNEDNDTLYAYLVAPRSASFQYTDANVKKLEAILNQHSDIVTYLTISGAQNPNGAFQIIILKPKSQRSEKLADLVVQLNAEASKIAGVRISVFPPTSDLAESTSGDNGNNVGIVIKTSSDYLQLAQASKDLMRVLRQNPAFLQVDNRLKWDSQQIEVNIDRERAADLQVSIADITNTLSTLIAGEYLGKTGDNDLWLKLNDASIANPNIFQSLYVRNAAAKMVPLGSIISLNETTAPDVYSHYERLRADTIHLHLAPTLKIADAIHQIEQLARNNLPHDMKFSFSGEAKTYLDSAGSTGLTFGLAIIFIYLVLVAQFESFIDPLVILLTVPFALIGALLTLYCFGGTLNIFSNIGLVTLIGLIAKHGILITDFANELRRKGMGVNSAVIEAATMRLRPILMTTSAMVLGALPLAFAFGPGAESRQQVGMVVTGGLFFGTVFSLLVVPVVYTYLAPFRKINSNSVE